MTDPGSPADRQYRYGMLLIGLGVLFIVLDVAVFALTGQAWVLLAALVAIPNFYRGFKAIREARGGDGR